MAQELFYTSSPRGLRLGVSGYCTVACTNGMAANYIEVLESLSGYAPIFPPNHPQAVLNPVAYSHYRYTIGGKVVNILSRVGFAGVDYTQRANKFAHHLVLDISERAAGGPAWVMQQPGVMAEKWVGPPKYLDLPKKMPGGDSVPAQCSAWERCTGDAGWGGVLAQSFLDNAREPAFIIFEAGMPTLNLVSEAIRLLPKEARWTVTFNTYFTSLPIGTSCAWRFCLKDDPALKQARRTPGALVVDLTAGGDQPAEARSRMSKGSALIEFARTGVPAAVTPKPGPLPQESPQLQLLPEPPPSNLPPAITLPPSQRDRMPRHAALVTDKPPNVDAPSRHETIVFVLAALLVASVGLNLWLIMTRKESRTAGRASGLSAAASTTPKPAAAVTHVFARLNAIDKIANIVSQKGQKELSVLNISADSHIDDLCWWDKTVPSKDVTMRCTDGKIEFMCPGEFDPNMTVMTVSFAPESHQVVFKPEPNAQPKQIEKLDLKSLGWIQLLADDKTEYVVFTNKRPDEKDAAQLSFDSNTGIYTGRLAIPEVLRTLVQPTLREPNKYKLSCQNAEKGFITITLSSNDAGKKLPDEPINDATIEFKVEGNVIASYALFHGKQSK